MPIFPLPQFEADLKIPNEEEDRKAYEALKAPKTLVVRFGSMGLIGEFPNDSAAKPGCGSKLVVRTFRGTELGEMLTSTCPNSGCSKSVSRKDMLQYIENSGGRDYPFFTDGRVVRLAEKEDVDRQAGIEQSKHELKTKARAVVARLGLEVKLVEIEPILGGERMTAYYLSEHRLELHQLARELSQAFGERVEMRQVGARDEARLTADYEKCGQYCCCKSFLKVLKPVSMRSAKTQKATLEPLKISGRCGRLMCCLRYEDQTYEDLKSKLPRRKSRVGTPEGDGMVLDSQILTQLVLIELDAPDATGQLRRVAVPVEELSEPQNRTMPPRPEPGEMPQRRGSRDSGRPERAGGPPRGGPGSGGRPPGPSSQQGASSAPQQAAPATGQPDTPANRPPAGPGRGNTQGNRPPGAQRPGPSDRDRGRPPQGSPQGPTQGPGPSQSVPPQGAGPDDDGPADGPDEIVFDAEGNEILPGAGGPSGTSDDGRKRRRRRRRRRGGPGGPGGSGAGPSGPPPGGPAA
ncbi:MAG: regulatory iron-sulfur-containing complex subunit RicT [Planctomycetota bacterium]